MARLKVSIVFDSGARIGPGKIKLLQSVRDTGSISAAAREMGMAYKRAWLLLDSINQAFEDPVVAGSPGGRHGGGAALTPFGLMLLERIGKIESAALAVTRKDMAALAKKARTKVGPKI